MQKLKKDRKSRRFLVVLPCATRSIAGNFGLWIGSKGNSFMMSGLSGQVGGALTSIYLGLITLYIVYKVHLIEEKGPIYLDIRTTLAYGIKLGK